MSFEQSACDTARLPPLSLYIHIPWCLRKCPYCDFNSHAIVAEAIPEAAYIACLLHDLALDFPLAQDRPLQSIFFGGGTPSLLSASGIGQILHAVKQQLTCGDDIEVTLEANPSTFEIARFAAYQDVGVNRLSIGVQSFDDGNLGQLGRVHDGDQAHAAIKAARQLGFAHINLDLMHGLPQQTPAMAVADLQRALEHNIDHLSWYQLTLEPNTAFHACPPLLPQDEALADIQYAGETILQRHGFSQYEISAWCQPGNQARHNLNYWQFGDYLGIGAGAHGKVTRFDAVTQQCRVQRQVKLRQPKAYMQTIAPLSSCFDVATEELPLEFFMNALRLREGVDESLFLQRTGLCLQEVPALHHLRSKKLLMPHRLQTTDRGWRFLNEVLAYF